MATTIYHDSCCTPQHPASYVRHDPAFIASPHKDLLAHLHTNVGAGRATRPVENSEYPSLCIPC